MSECKWRACRFGDMDPQHGDQLRRRFPTTSDDNGVVYYGREAIPLVGNIVASVCLTVGAAAGLAETMDAMSRAQVRAAAP